MDLEKNSILSFPQAESLKNVVADAIEMARQKGASQAEAGLSVSQGLSVATRMGSVETIEHQQDNGLGISHFRFNGKLPIKISGDTCLRALYDDIDPDQWKVVFDINNST